MNDATIAIDIGGTKIAAALIQQQQIIAKRKIDSVVHRNLATLPDTIYALCQDWLTEASSVAVATTGQVGQDNVGFLSAKQHLPLQQLLSARLKLPVTILNDAAAAAYAEFHQLKQQGLFDDKVENLVYITVSTGVGGGIIQNGHLVTCDNGFCAHLGHVSVPFTGIPIRCHCGRYNCVEAISSGTAIAKRASALLNIPVTCEEMFADHQHRIQVHILIDEVADALTELIANAKAWTGTEYVVLGGSVGQNDTLFNVVQHKLSKLPALYHTRLFRPSCGSDADLWGAFWYAQQQNRDKPDANSVM